MKIILWPRCALPHIGGVEVATHTLAMQLIEHGHEVIVIASQLNSTEFSTLILDGVKIYTMPFISALTEHNLVLIKKTLVEVDTLIDAFCPDIVHIHDWTESVAFYQARSLQKKSIPILITLHNDLTGQKKYRAPNCLQLLHLAAGFSAVSRAVLDDYVTFAVLTKPPITLIYNALRPNSIALQAIPHNYHLVMIGRLSIEKGFAIGFKALQLLIEKYPRLHLTLVGDGPGYEYLKQLSVSLGLENSINMVGFIAPNQVYTFIDQAHLVLMPSTYEPFGLVALETAMRGRAIIASNIVGLKEVVIANETGLLVEPADPGALATAIDYLLSHPDEINQMGQAALAYAEKTFDLATHTQQHLSLYQCVMDKHHA